MKKFSNNLRQQFRHTIAVSQSKSISKAERDLLPIVAAAVAQGDDIRVCFPEFWHTLLQNRLLQEALLEIVAIVETDDDLASDPPTPFDPSFLRQSPPKPQSQQWSAEKWRVKWHQTVEQLQYQTNQSVSTQRRARQWSRTLALFESHISLESGDLTVTLKVTHVSGASTVKPAIIIDYASPYTPDLSVNLTWGTYSDTIDTSIQTEFSDLSLNKVGAGTLDGIATPLELTVQPIKK